MVIQHNLLANFNQRTLGIQTNLKGKAAERLSTGYKINRAADNAAALTISEKMRGQIRGLMRASDNALDGISYVQTADGALHEMQALNQRVRELCVQAANDTNVEEDRKAIQGEINALTEEIDRVCEQTEFNTIKIWEVPYVPNVTGIPRELKMWNDVDASGKLIYGGIIWGEERFAWNEVDSALYDASTNTFHAGEYKFEVPVVKFDPRTDSYVKTGEKTELDLVVDKDGQTPPEIYRKCNWSAGDEGITMDGVLYKWNELEDSNHRKTFDPNNIQPGKNYGFDTYNGTHVWFTIPKDSEDIRDVINGINGDGLNDLGWTVKLSSQTSLQAVKIDMADSITITENNKNNITTSYVIKADDTGVWVQNGNGLNLGKETWQQLRLEDNTGVFEPAHDLTYHGYYNDTTVPDDHNDAAHTNGWGYTTGMDGYNATVIPGIDFQFSVLQEAAKESVISGLNNAYVSTTIRTPSKVNVTAGNGLGKLTNIGASTRLNFNFHKDFGRNFDSASGALGSAVIDSASSIWFKLNFTGANGATDEFTSNQAVLATRTNIETLLNSTTGGNFLLNFSDGKGNQINAQYHVNALSAQEKADIANGIKGINDYVDAIIADLGTVALEVDGRATQSYSARENTKGNVGKYTNFRTDIVFQRKVMIQVGANTEQAFELKYRALSHSVLGLSNIDVSSHENASNSISVAEHSLEILSEERSKFGAYQNRLEHVIAVDDNTAENLQAAESTLRDADIAEEMMKYAKYDILCQSGISILAQTSRISEGVLKLLQ